METYGLSEKQEHSSPWWNIVQLIQNGQKKHVQMTCFDPVPPPAAQCNAQSQRSVPWLAVKIALCQHGSKCLFVSLCMLYVSQGIHTPMNQTHFQEGEEHKFSNVNTTGHLCVVTKILGDILMTAIRQWVIKYKQTVCAITVMGSPLLMK